MAFPTTPAQTNQATGAGGGASNPTPWWQLAGPNGGGAAANANLTASAPTGYKWDQVQMKYVRTPGSVGADQGAAINGLTGALAAPGSGYNAFGGYGGGSSTNASLAYGGAGSPYTPPAVSMPGGSAGGGSNATIQSSSLPATINGGGNAAQIAAIQGPNMDAANAAAFAAAKDQTGQEARGALTGLAGAMAGRGISGSGVEGRGQVGVVNQGQQELGAASRQQAVNQATLAETNALASYQGDVTQRGQNIENMNAQTGFGVTQRGQDIGAQQAAEAALVAQRGQDMSLRGLEYQGGISQRGQDIQNSYQQGQLGLSAQELALRKSQAALTGLGTLGSLTGNSTATY